MSIHFGLEISDGISGSEQPRAKESSAGCASEEEVEALDTYWAKEKGLGD